MTLYDNKGITIETEETRLAATSRAGGALQSRLQPQSGENDCQEPVGGRSNGMDCGGRGRAMYIFWKPWGGPGRYGTAARTRKHSQICVCNGNESRKLAEIDKTGRSPPAKPIQARGATGGKPPAKRRFDRVGIWSRDRDHPRRDARHGGSAHGSRGPSSRQWTHATVAGERRRRRP
ncbi:hypothetical protein VTN96DRAFT_599 [Rasamsonia emersonii]